MLRKAGDDVGDAVLARPGAVCDRKPGHDRLPTAPTAIVGARETCEGGEKAPACVPEGRRRCFPYVTTSGVM